MSKNIFAESIHKGSGVKKFLTFSLKKGEQNLKYNSLCRSDQVGVWDCIFLADFYICLKTQTDKYKTVYLVLDGMINFWNNTFGICLHKSILSFENGSNDVARHCYLHQKCLEQEMSEFKD